MRRVSLGKTGIEAGVLGFGCASLGSRVGAAAGLRAMAEAHDAGVDWFDLAPAYGRGQAETIASDFLRGRRERVRICTKVGLAPPAAGGLASGLVPLARGVVGVVPGLRALVRRTGVQRNARLPLTPALVTGSLEASLHRLGTDRVELYALHNATAAEIARDDIARALEDILAAGKARAVAVAGDAAAAAAAVARGAPFAVVQMALPAPGETGAGPAALAAARAAGMGRVVHSVLGVEGVRARLEARLGADPQARAELEAATGGSPPATGLAALLVARAFALDPGALVVMSMFSAASLRANLALAAPSPDPEAVGRLERLAG